MRATWKALLFLLFTTAGVSWAGEMRTWTIWEDQSIEAKTVAFERRSLKFSRHSGAILVNGIAYVRLKPHFKTVVDLVMRRHGFDDVAAVLADKNTLVKDLDYLRVVFRTKDDQTLRIPLDALAGADEQTGDYKLAYDEALVWLKAHQEQSAAPPPVAASDRDAAARLEEQRRQLEQQRQQLDEQQCAAAAQQAAATTAAQQAAATTAAQQAAATTAAQQAAAATAAQQAADAAKKRDEEKKRAEAEAKKKEDDRKREEERKKREEEQKNKDAAKKK